MKRITFLLLAVAITLLGITIVATKNYAIEDKYSAHKHAQEKAQKPTPRVDGSKDPSKIPDDAAYEILFKLLSKTDPQDQHAAQRKSAYMRLSGFHDGEAAAISNAAFEYKRQLDPLDVEVDNIKKTHWPNPDQRVKGQLDQLQRQKEIAIESVVNSLQTQLNHYPDPTKLSSHIINDIKRKTKGFAVDLPKKKVSKLADFFSDLFAASAQAPGCDSSLYIYSNTFADMNNLVVYSDNSYSLPYNNCGHQITLNATLNGDTNLNYYLYDGSVYHDGLFQTQVYADSYCPVVNETYPAGSNSSETNVESYVVITGFGNPTRTHLTNGHDDVTFTGTYSVSVNATGKKFSVTPGIEITQGSLNLNDFTSTPSGTHSVTVGGPFTIKYSVVPTAANGKFKASFVASTDTVTVHGSPKFQPAMEEITVH